MWMKFPSDMAAPDNRIKSRSKKLNTHFQVRAGVDYGLGSIGTCLGPPSSGGPPSVQREKNSYDSCEKKRNEGKMIRMGYCLLYYTSSKL